MSSDGQITANSLNLLNLSASHVAPIPRALTDNLSLMKDACDRLKADRKTNLKLGKTTRQRSAYVEKGPAERKEINFLDDIEGC